MQHLNGLDVLVLGLGDSGLAMARWCARHGATLRVWDSRAAPPQAAALALAVPEAVLFSGPLDADALQPSKLILKSPGLAPHDARITPLLATARAQGLAVQGELDLFARALADLRETRGHVPKVLAITGTNGKTTTAALTALLVERSGLCVALAGNIGPTMLDTLSAALDAVDAEGEPAPLPEVWVLELSSFQLDGGGDGVRGFEPSAAAVLNITQDHLDWHGSMPAYAAAKARIFGEHAVRVINRDDAQVEALVAASALPAASSKNKAKPAPARATVRFGLGAPQAAGDFGLVVEHGMAWLVRAQADEATPRKRGATAETLEFHLQRLMPADALRIRGRHNAANALAALALASAIGCPLAPMLHALRDYRGEPHRVAFVARIGEVDAYDDSKGTNVGATVAALQGLGADRHRASWW